MKLNTKDAQILEHIIKYCTDIQMAIEHFGKEEEIFSQNPVYLGRVEKLDYQIYMYFRK